jgi:hypothetical protein
MDTFEFSVDHPRTITEIDKFEAKFDPKNKNGPMKILKYIGQYVANAMINNPEYIKKPWLEISSDLWKEMYDYVDMEVPDWITNYELPDGLEQAWASEEERLFTVFKQLVLRNATTGEIYNDDENYRPRTPRDKADEVVKGSIENWIQLISPKKGRNKDKNLVVIDAGIVEDMTKEYHLPYELKRIAEDLKGEYDGIHFNGRTHKVAYWELDKFLDMFGAM